MRPRLLVALVPCALAIAGCATSGTAGFGEPSGDGDGVPASSWREPVRARGVVVYPRLGNTEDDPINGLGPALVLMGGQAKVPSAFEWAHEVVGGQRKYAGDVVVLTFADDDSYAASMIGATTFNSARTVRLLPHAGASDYEIAAFYVDFAEVVFLVGDDADAFARWRRTPLASAIQAALGRGAVLGGVGAGASVLGDFAFDGGAQVTTSDALDDPYEATIRFSRQIVDIPALESLVVEPRFRDADRFGRLAAFMARQVGDGTLAVTPPRVLGLGVDDGAAALVDRFGRVAIAQNDGSSGNVYVLDAGVPDQIAPSRPLIYSNILVARLDAPGETYELGRGCGTAFRYSVSVRGGAAQPYTPADPYVAAGLPRHCE